MLELASDAKAPVRVASIDALDRAIVGTLGSPKAAVQRTQSEGVAGTAHALLHRGLCAAGRVSRW